MKKKTRKSGQTITKTIIGIDYSLTSPAVCVNIDGDAGLMFYYLTSKKKYTGMMSEEIVGYEHKEFKSPIERFTNLSGWVLHILDTLHKKQKITHIGMVWQHDKIIHASGQVKIDTLTEKGILSNNKYTHNLHSLRRLR